MAHMVQKATLMSHPHGPNNLRLVIRVWTSSNHYVTITA